MLPSQWLVSGTQPREWAGEGDETSTEEAWAVTIVNSNSAQGNDQQNPSYEETAASTPSLEHLCPDMLLCHLRHYLAKEANVLYIEFLDTAAN